MAAQRTFSVSQGWVAVDSLLVVEISAMGSTVNRAKFIEFIGINEFLQVRVMSAGWLQYRIHEDSIDGTIVRTGYLPDWRVVEVVATT